LPADLKINRPCSSFIKVLWGLFLFPICCFSQSTITGKVINAADKTPVGYATVFLNNTMVATRTADDGTFSLINVRTGQYDLVVSFVGFETHHQNLSITGANINLPVIELAPKIKQLKEVRIGPPDPHRNEYLDVFTREFIGTSANAQQCKITNPDVIDISYDASNRTLNASSDDFLVIENKALGYKIRYQVNKFVKAYSQNFTYYEGPVVFEEMTGSPAQTRKWIKSRQDVYKSSDMHFLRTLFTGQLEQEGFKVMKLIKKPNPARPPDSLIKAKIREFNRSPALHPGWRDSSDYWMQKAGLPKIVEYLVTKPLGINDFVTKTTNTDQLALYYTDYLYVMYTKKRDLAGNSKVYHPLDIPNYPTTVVALNSKYAVFDKNGIFADPASTTYDGAWGEYKVAEMLPEDYTPTP